MSGTGGIDRDLTCLLLCRGMETLAAEKAAFEKEKKAHTELYETQQQVCGQFLVAGYGSPSHHHMSHFTHHTLTPHHHTSHITPSTTPSHITPSHHHVTLHTSHPHTTPSHITPSHHTITHHTLTPHHHTSHPHTTPSHITPSHHTITHHTLTPHHHTSHPHTTPSHPHTP